MSKFETLTDYIPILQGDKIGEWDVDDKNDGSPTHPIEFRGVHYTDNVRSFRKAFYDFCETHPEYEKLDYQDVLKTNGIEWETESMSNADVTSKDATCIIALILAADRAERFCDGAFLDFFQKGCIVRWLERLQVIDKES